MKKFLTGEKNRTKRIQLKNDNPDADGEKTEKVDESLYGTGTDRNGRSNDRIRSRRSAVRYQ